jgi:hypothetical protein
MVAFGLAARRDAIWQIYPALHLTVDPGWLIAMRYRAEGGSDIGVFSAPARCWRYLDERDQRGYFAGALVSDPRTGIDLVMPVFFTAMLVPLWRGARRAVAWAIGGGRADGAAAPRRLVVHRHGRSRRSVAEASLMEIELPPVVTTGDRPLPWPPRSR